MAAELGASVEVTPRVPSLAYRMCMAARGVVDFAVAAENSHDWDIAAADLVLEEAGARLIDASGDRLRYNSRQVRRGALLAAPDTAAPGSSRAFAPPSLSGRNKRPARPRPACVFAAARAKASSLAPRCSAALQGNVIDELPRCEGSGRGKAAAAAPGVWRRTEVARKPRVSRCRQARYRRPLP